HPHGCRGGVKSQVLLQQRQVWLIGRREELPNFNGKAPFAILVSAHRAALAVETTVRRDTQMVREVFLEVGVNQVMAGDMARPQQGGNSCTEDDSALTATRQHHVEQLALAIRRASDKAAISGHDIELCHVVDLSAVMVARIADAADAECSTDGDSRAV